MFIEFSLDYFIEPSNATLAVSEAVLTEEDALETKKIKNQNKSFPLERQ